MSDNLAYTMRTRRAVISVDGIDLVTELEHSRGWANSNPELAFASLQKFCDDHAEHAILVDTSRPGFVTYCAFKPKLVLK